MPPGSSLATFAHRPEQETQYPGAPRLGQHIIAKMMEQEFDVGTSKSLPSDGNEWSRGSLPHAFGFILRQIMKDKPIPHLPVLINTFYPPNQPTAQRVHRFGKALEDGDREFRPRMCGSPSSPRADCRISSSTRSSTRNSSASSSKGDVKGMTTMPESYLQSGTSEFKNWIPVGAIAHDAGLQDGSRRLRAVLPLVGRAPATPWDLCAGHEHVPKEQSATESTVFKKERLSRRTKCSRETSGSRSGRSRRRALQRDRDTGISPADRLLPRQRHWQELHRLSRKFETDVREMIAQVVARGQCRARSTRLSPPGGAHPAPAAG